MDKMLDDLLNERPKSNEFKFRWIIAILPACALLFFFIMFRLCVFNEVYYKSPFVTEIRGIASDGTNIYTLDDDFNSICKYDQTGALVYCIRYRSASSSYIYCGESGELRRYEAGTQCVYVYDELGNCIQSYEAAGDELKLLIKDLDHQKRIEANGQQYELNNRLLWNSTIDSSESDVQIVVESVWYHLIRNILVLATLGLAIYGFLHLGAYILTNLQKMSY